MNTTLNMNQLEFGSICHVVSEENGFYSLETTDNDEPQVMTKAQTKTLLLFLSFLVEKFLLKFSWQVPLLLQ